MILTLGVGLYALIPLIPTGLPVSPVLFLIFIPLINFFRGSMTNFTDNILVRNCNELRLNFGAIRSVGSFLYMVGGVLISALLPMVGVPSTFWLSAVCMLPGHPVCRLRPGASYEETPHGAGWKKGETQFRRFIPQLFLRHLSALRLFVLHCLQL